MRPLNGPHAFFIAFNSSLQTKITSIIIFLLLPNLEFKYAIYLLYFRLRRHFQTLTLISPP